MKTFSEELIEARTEKGISLSDISAHTRINIKYLEAIDQGLFDVLPQTYIRAFLKQYAEFVGLDANDIIKKYDLMVVGKLNQGNLNEEIVSSYSTETSSELLNQIEIENTKTEFDNSKAEEQQKKRKLISIIAITSFIFLIVIYVLNFIFTPLENNKIEETPFEEVLKSDTAIKSEKDQNIVDIPVQIKDSTKSEKIEIAKIETPIANIDSLVLKTISGKDTIWLNIKSDENRSRNAYLLPNEVRFWHAKDKFVITCGNAGSITIELNGKSLGSLGPRGSAVKNLELTRKDLDLE